MTGAVFLKVATLLSSEKDRHTAAIILTAVFLPLILIAAFLCSAASGGADHNNLAVEASFYGTSFTDTVPAEFRAHISEMQEAFRLLDADIASANSSASEVGGHHPIQVTSHFLCPLLRRGCAQPPRRRPLRRLLLCRGRTNADCDNRIRGWYCDNYRRNLYRS